MRILIALIRFIIVLSLESSSIQFPSPFMAKMHFQFNKLGQTIFGHKSSCRCDDNNKNCSYLRAESCLNKSPLLLTRLVQVWFFKEARSKGSYSCSLAEH